MVAPTAAIRRRPIAARELARRLRIIERRLRRVLGPPPPPRRLSPLDELVLTILSQHTSDVNRDRAYADLRRRFASWDDIADAPVVAIARAIRRGGLGPTKAVRIRALLRELRAEGVALDARAFRDSSPQKTWERLIELPGVGPKTAACVLLFSLGQPYFPVDTHVHRVAKRLGLVPQSAGPVESQQILQAATPPRLVYPLHLNLIRHGRSVCRAPRPLCEECVLLDICPRVGVASPRPRRPRRRM
jgi:endonuclease-3